MLKILVLQKQRTAIETKLKGLRTQRAALSTREADLKTRLDAMPENATEEQLRSISEEVENLTAEQTRTDDAIAAALDELETLNAQISEAGEGSPADPADQRSTAPESTRAVPGVVALTAEIPSGNFISRSRAFTSRSQRDAFYARSEVKEFLTRVRGLAGQKRAVTGAELAIPEVILDLIRDNLSQYSKLIDRVRLRPVKGTARELILGEVPEGVWTEMKGAVNELTFAITELETDGYKVGGYIPVDNYLLDDSDIALGEEIILMLGQAIGYALDKAIVYGKGPSYKMPVGIATRLAASSQPAWWGTNQGTFTDLHSSNVITLNIAGSTGTAFFQPLLAALGKAKPKYSAGRATWIMSHKTHMDLLGRALTFNAAGSLVAGIRDQMPVESGDIVELEFIPDNEIVGGFLDVYVLAERDGGRFGASDLPLFLQDKTVFKATARYDGQPARGEAFVIVNYNNTSPTTAKDFATDYANEAMNALICTAAAGGSVGKTVVTVSGAVAGSPTLKYAVAYQGSIAVGATVGTAFADLTSGTTAITAGAGTPITVVELDSNSRVISMGTVGSVPKTS